MAQTSKAFPYTSFIPGYINGLQLAWTSNTTLTVSAGSVLDSTQTFQLTNNAPITISSGASGLNGLDSGTIAASTLYAVYLVADPVSANVTGAIISTSLTGPLLPFGYGSYALIGFIATNSSSQFLLGYWSAGDSPWRLFTYDAPQATAVTAGAATTYTAVNLSALVPAVALTPVLIASSFTPAVAGHTLNLQPYGATGNAITITGQVATVPVTANSLLFSNLTSGGAPEVNYKVTASGDAAALTVAGYYFIL